MAVGTSLGWAGQVNGMSADDLLLYSGTLLMGCIASCGPYVSGEPGDGGCALPPYPSVGLRLVVVDGVLPCKRRAAAHDRPAQDTSMAGRWQSLQGSSLVTALKSRLFERTM